MKNTGMFREFTRYTIPNVLGMIGLSCYILADTFFVAGGLGADGLTALNLAIPVYSFVNGTGLMLGMGGATRYTIQKSQNALADANRAFTGTVLLGLFFALFYLGCGLFLSGPITAALGADASVFAMSQTYLQVILLFAPLFLLNSILLCFVRNDGAPRLAMLAMLGGSLSNIVLDYVFIFPLGMGIFGAVLATGLAPAISMLLMLPYFIRGRAGFHLTRSSKPFSYSTVIFSCGLPSLVTEVSSGVVIIVFNTIILRLAGNTGVAAYGVIANLSLVVLSVYTGIAQGVQPLLSRYYGQRKPVHVRTVLQYALLVMCVLSALVYSGVFFGAGFITSIFNGERNALLQAICVPGLRIYFTGCVFAGFNIILSVFFTSTQNARPAHIISLLRGFALIVPLAFALATVLGLTGVWLAFPAAESISALPALLLCRKALKRAALPQPGADHSSPDSPS